MRRSDSSLTSLDDRAVLRDLLSENEPRQTAWTEFLRRFSDLILKIAWEFASDRDEAMAAYLFVCERLAADDFAKLRTYDPAQSKSPAKVSTWLAVVVRNLCIEHYRQTEGRQRYPDAVADLSPIDQRVFELYFWEGESPREIVRRLETSSEYAADQVQPALDRLRDLDLHPSKTWARRPPRQMEAFEDSLHGDNQSAEERRSKKDRRTWMHDHLEKLPPKERLAVRWYYWTGVSASTIGQLLEVSQRKVYTLMERALQKLRDQIGDSTVEM